MLEITSGPGAYLIVVDLSVSCEVSLGRRHPITIPPACYAYCGSAYGPGGLRARVSRHLKREKPIRWHIDQLTSAGPVIGYRLWPGGNECDILQQLSRHAGVGVPIPGFGSSDCTGCPAHLVSLPVHFSLPDFGQPGPPAPTP